MIIETEFGQFELVKDYREAFNLEMFIERYVAVAFNKYTYIVGDVSSEKLRLRGFNKDPKSTNGFTRIPDYLNESCNYNCAYFILKRLDTKGKRKKEKLVEDDTENENS
eukprot:Anaeramoba_ignava/a96442_4.p2 GENE.a96442_4~~a96442_4.p2  ORF type:complete len:109 (-),score=12.65 a96442_4:179-505(-)